MGPLKGALCATAAQVLQRRERIVEELTKNERSTFMLARMAKMNRFVASIDGAVQQTTCVVCPQL